MRLNRREVPTARTNALRQLYSGNFQASPRARFVLVDYICPKERRSVNFAIGSVARRQRSALNAPLCSHRGPRAKGARPPRRTTRLNGCRDYLSSLAAKSDILVESPAVSISLRRQEIETVTGYISDSLIHAHFIAVQKDSDQYSQLKGRSLTMVPLHFSMPYVCACAGSAGGPWVV